MSATKHVLVTGHSGAGKTTLARSFGLPMHSLDDDPDIQARLEFQKQYSAQNGGRLPVGGEHAVKMREAERAAIQRALALRTPHVIEGSYLLNTPPNAYKRHSLHLVDVDPELAVQQRVERQRLKDISRGRPWSDERAAGVAMRGRQLVDEYAPGVARWREAAHVTKHTRGQEKTSAVEYRGHTFPGYNQPIQAGEGKHKMMVLAKKGDDVKLVRFGHRGYRHNYSPEAKANYLKRSAGIRDGSGNLTKDDKFSANYWARKHLWPRNQEADGSALKKQAAAENYRHRATILLRNKDGHILATPKPAFTTMQFPGGGIHEDERFDMPTEAEILAGARREAREELGHDLVNPRYIGALRNAMDERFRERQTLKRGVPIHGLHEHYVVAEPGPATRRAHGIAGDKFRGDYMPLNDILWHMDKDARGFTEGAEHAAREAALLRKHLVKESAILPPLPPQVALPAALLKRRVASAVAPVVNNAKFQANRAAAWGMTNPAAQHFAQNPDDLQQLGQLFKFGAAPDGSVEVGGKYYRPKVQTQNPHLVKRAGILPKFGPAQLYTQAKDGLDRLGFRYHNFLLDHGVSPQMVESAVHDAASGALRWSHHGPLGMAAGAALSLADDAILINAKRIPQAANYVLKKAYGAGLDSAYNNLKNDPDAAAKFLHAQLSYRGLQHPTNAGLRQFVLDHYAQRFGKPLPDLADLTKVSSVGRPHDAVEVDGKYYRPKVQTFMYDKRGRILASRSQAKGLRAYDNYKFPGGGIEPNEDVLDAARKELLEEAGYTPGGDMFEFGKPTHVDWDSSFREQAAKKGRGAYHGQYEYYVAGPLGKRDTSRFGSEGDAMTGLELVRRDKLRKALERTANDPNNEYAYFDKQKLVALGELEKQLLARKLIKAPRADQ